MGRARQIASSENMDRIILNGTDVTGTTDAGDFLLLDASAAGTDVGFFVNTEDGTIETPQPNLVLESMGTSLLTPNTTNEDDQVVIRVSGDDIVKIGGNQNASAPVTIAGGDRSYENLTNPDIRDSDLLLTNTDNANAAAPIIRLDRESANPAADDNIGRMSYTGRNAAGEVIEYARVTARIEDTSDGTEMGGYQIQCTHNGSNIQRLKIDQNEMVINESQIDSDFRIETDTKTHTFFVDAGEDTVAINTSTAVSDAKFTVNGVKDATFGRTVMRLRDSDTIVDSGNTMMVCQFSGDANAQGGTFIAFRDSGAEIGSVSCTGTSNVAFSTSSDYRLKENIKTMDDAWDKVKALNPVNFTWKNSPSDPAQDGFIAHELQEIIPQAVDGEKDAILKRADGTEEMDVQGVDYGKLSPLLTKCLQEAIAKIEILEAKVAKLEG